MLAVDLRHHHAGMTRADMVLMDLSGRKYLEKTGIGNEQFNLPMGMNKGVYIIQLKGEGKQISKRIVIE